MEGIKEIVLDYAYSTTANNFALMISGEWGSGKTYFFDKNLKPKIELKGKKVIYVSLNGVNSTQEIFTSILAERVKFIDWAANNKYGKVITSLLGSVINIGFNSLKLLTNSTLFAEIDPKSSDLKPVPLRDFFTIANDKYFICFDDLERIGEGISIASVLGFINSNFIEHEGVKVLILCDEPKLKLKADKNGPGYDDIKEKVIGRTIEFRSNIDELIPSFFIHYINDKKVYEFLKKNHPYIVYKIKASKEVNLRKILFALDVLSKIAKAGKDVFLEEHGEEIILSVVIFSFEHLAGKFSRFKNEKDLPSILKPIVLADLELAPNLHLIRDLVDGDYQEGKEVKEEIDYQDSVKERYLVGDERRYKYFSSVYKFITTGFLDERRLNEELKELSPEAPPHIIALQRLRNGLGQSNEKFLALIPEVLEYIQTGKYSLQQFLEAAFLLIRFIELGLIEAYTVASIQIFLIDFVFKVRDQTNLEDFDQLKFEINHSYDGLKKYDKIWSVINDFMQTLEIELKKIQIFENLEKLKKGGSLNFDEFNDVIAFHQIESIVEVIIYRFEIEPIKIREIIDIFETSYLDRSATTSLKILPILGKIQIQWEAFGSKISKENQPISFYWFDKLNTSLRKIIEKINRENKGKVV